MKFAIYSYNGAGASMRALSRYLGDAPILNKQSAPDVGNKLLVNYGASYLRLNWNPKWLNKPDAISNAIHKLVTFNLCERAGIACPIWTQNQATATEWVRDGKTVFARETSTGSEGHGIRILNNRRDEVPYVEFYSQALNHDDEYRVHVVKGRVISVGLKHKKKHDANMYIRNIDNGWAFYLGVDAPESVKRIGQKAVDALGMDFGAADIGYCRAANKPYVFEVNSAPTMSEPTAQAYASAFIDYERSL